MMPLARGRTISEKVGSDPSQHRVDQIIELKSEEKRQAEVEEHRRIEGRCLEIGKEGLAASVSVRPQGETSLSQQLRAQLARRYLPEGDVPIEDRLVCEKELVKR